jgi:hypothetical protein
MRISDWTWVLTVLAGGLLAGCQTTSPPGRLGVSGGDAARADIPSNPPSPSDQNIAFMRGHQTYRAQVIEQARRSLAHPPEPCTAANVAVGAHVETLEPVTGSAGAGFHGIWVDRLDVSGCPGTPTIGVVVRVTGNRVEAIGLPRGNGRADFVLLSNSLGQAKAPAVQALGCGAGDVRLTVTRFDAFIGPAVETLPGRDGRQWREIWTFIGCRKAVEVLMHFKPISPGTAFHVGEPGPVWPLPPASG